MKIVKNHFITHKFGGSSLADANRFKAVKQILSGKKEIIVVSAIKGTTSTLQHSLDIAREGDNYLPDLKVLEDRHIALINTLISKNSKNLLKSITEDFEFIHNILNTVKTIRSYATEIQNFVLGFGEIWSAKILNAYLNLYGNSEYLDASSILYSYVENEVVCIDWEKSYAELVQFVNNKDFDQLVVTGFIAKTLSGQRTILGRNGSDYSGAIFAKLFKAKCLYIWTDVDGIYTAHPQKVKSAFVIEQLSYKEAHELAYFGASVLYPMTVLPVESENIPLYIKNSFNPTAKGTYISQESIITPYMIKGITYVSDIALINIEGAGLIGVAGTAARIFQILKDINVSVILISQASSEHSICFAINNRKMDLAVKTLQEQLHMQISGNLVGKITANPDCSIVAAVGEEMIGAIGVAGKICDTLAKANVNIRAIAQGSSERNISVVINNSDINKALQALHAGFYLSSKTLSIGLIGPGAIGKTLLKQISDELEHLKTKYQVNLCVRGIMDSQHMLLENTAINLNKWEENLKKSKDAANMTQFTQHILSDDVPNAVIIDCTASLEISKKYLDFAKKGINIITPNKHASGGSTLEFYQELKSTVRENNCQYLYEATVCAGLPIINTISDLIKTGDEITAIEGVVSGTLSYIFSELAIGRKFSDVVTDAKKLGYTEPDPREDLSGKDIGRKLICLAREIGYDVSLNEIEIVNLVPPSLRKCTQEEFMTRLTQCDASMHEMVEEANKNDKKLRYVASIKADKTFSVAIQSYAKDHPFNRLRGTDNMLIIHSKRYCNNQPIIIQGPGAGAEVTAAGVFADLLRLSASI
ncbi:MAG: bifunctional aspartate kinase/homoserine dehydrogenase [Burkholderiales bacterium]|jgi:aspartokinase/homoserine dehydrogenase 1|nr:bifunctional aspartate kinase/homoserine dehydrogenase [Burkholderiales bacterium]